VVCGGAGVVALLAVEL